ncbi:MAG: hypothetical protein KAT05_12535 [Spirochaetes bacterium]|nr:hypothetical protein [Spirochaetota bacterium]
MINSINLSTYNKIARINQTLNRFIREVAITKSQINTSILSPFSSHTGIGKKIDIFA